MCCAVIKTALFVLLEKTEPQFRFKGGGIETTIRNEDYKYKAGFGFLDSWGYTKRKDVKEIEITLSQWLYDGICAKGYLTPGLKRTLQRCKLFFCIPPEQQEYALGGRKIALFAVSVVESSIYFIYFNNN